ncbi:hypothetical protein ACQ4PT_033357 [Festuca glaucescens]
MAERPVAPVRPMDDGFWLERDHHHDTAAAAASDAVVSAYLVCDGDVQAIHDLLMGYQDQHGEDQHALLLHDDHGDAPDYSEDDYQDADPEDSDDDDDDDSEEEEEESDGEFDELWLLLPRFLLGGSAPHFVAAGRTAGFMRVAAADAENHAEGCERQILVYYRYTRFSAASSSDGSVEACGSTREHQLRFIASAGHGARSLAWAGATDIP